MVRSAAAAVVLTCLAFAVEASACSVCQGNPDSELSKGAQAGVLFMVLVTYGLLLSLAGMAAVWMVRARRLRRQSSLLQEPPAVESGDSARNGCSASG